jgi:hypothetical protein
MRVILIVVQIYIKILLVDRVIKKSEISVNNIQISKSIIINNKSSSGNKFGVRSKKGMEGIYEPGLEPEK